MKHYRIENAASDTPELYLYGYIGDTWMEEGITAKQVVADLNKLGKKKDLIVRIDSPGGQVFEGTNIYNALLRNPARVSVHIDALAASIASVIAMAGNEIVAADNALLMIHDPAGMVGGTAADMRKMADTLDKVRSNLVGTYASRTKLAEDKISQLMADETWMTATEALQLGFVERLESGAKMTACARSVDWGKLGYRRVPTYLTAARDTPRMERYRAKAGQVFRMMSPAPS